MKRFVCSLAIVAAGAGLIADAAQAGPPSIRYASPTGSGTACDQATPCDIRTAVTNGPAGGQIKLFSGDYSLGSTTLVITNNKTVGAVTPQDPPVLTGTNAGILVQLNLASGTADGSRLSDVRIVSNNGSSSALVLNDGEHVVERVTVELNNVAATPNSGTSSACFLDSGTIRDSVCWNHGQGNAINSIGIDPFVFDSNLRNVTAYSDHAAGLYLSAFNGGTTSVNAVNSIVVGGGQYDVVAQGGANSAAGATLEYSDFVTANEDASFGGTQAITDPGTMHNITSEPEFVDAANGDFHETQDAPTIDIGNDSVVVSGEFDFDLENRIIGTVDMGADERRKDLQAPAIQIDKGPKPKTKSKKAKFVFSAVDDVSGPNEITYECSLDNKPLKACSSPQTYKNLRPGKHIFGVEATDALGKTSDRGEFGWKVQQRK